MSARNVPWAWAGTWERDGAHSRRKRRGEPHATLVLHARVDARVAARTAGLQAVRCAHAKTCAARGRATDMSARGREGARPGARESHGSPGRGFVGRLSCLMATTPAIPGVHPSRRAPGVVLVLGLPSATLETRVRCSASYEGAISYPPHVYPFRRVISPAPLPVTLVSQSPL